MIVIYLLLALVSVVLVAHTFCYLFVGRTRHTEVAQYLQSSDSVEIVRGNWLLMRPRKLPVKAGVIFHPGGYVDPEAYAKIFHHIAAQGFLSILVPAPQRTPMAKRFAADEVIDTFPQIKHWFLAGHSQGGAVVSLYIRDRDNQPHYKNKISGLIFLGFFVFDRHSHSHRNLPCLSIYGSRDGHAEKFRPNEKNLPKNAKVICIDGGNHGQFGAYDFHFGDKKAEIPRHIQQDIAVSEIITFMNETLKKELSL